MKDADLRASRETQDRGRSCSRVHRQQSPSEAGSWLGPQLPRARGSGNRDAEEHAGRKGHTPTQGTGASRPDAQLIHSGARSAHRPAADLASSRAASLSDPSLKHLHLPRWIALGGRRLSRLSCRLGLTLCWAAALSSSRHASPSTVLFPGIDIGANNLAGCRRPQETSEGLACAQTKPTRREVIRLTATTAYLYAVRLPYTSDRTTGSRNHRQFCRRDFSQSGRSTMHATAYAPQPRTSPSCRATGHPQMPA